MNAAPPCTTAPNNDVESTSVALANPILSLANPSSCPAQHLSLQLDVVSTDTSLTSPLDYYNSLPNAMTTVQTCSQCGQLVQQLQAEVRSLTTKLNHEVYAREVLTQLNRRNDEELAKLLMEANRIKDETEVAYGDLMEDYEHLLEQIGRERRQHQQVLQDLKETSEERATLKMKINEFSDENDKLINDLIQYKMSFASSSMYSDDLCIQNQFLQRQLLDAHEEVEWLKRQLQQAQEVLRDHAVARSCASGETLHHGSTPSKQTMTEAIFGFLRPTNNTNQSSPRSSSQGFSSTHSSRSNSIHGSNLRESVAAIDGLVVDANVAWKEYISPQETEVEEVGHIEMREIQPLEIELPDNFQDLLQHGRSNPDAKYYASNNNSTMARLSDVILL